ncbi:MAG: helix-turn-helix transcriptional regulator [Bacteroidetes bacterium]|nr:helix-turn-helix transcriptional regulator [Bacteroidota bacterium]
MLKYRDEKILTQFGKHLKQVRASKKATQEELAYTSGLSLSQIARIETGKINPTLCTILEIAKNLNVKPQVLLSFL